MEDTCLGWYVKKNGEDQAAGTVGLAVGSGLRTQGYLRAQSSLLTRGLPLHRCAEF